MPRSISRLPLTRTLTVGLALGLSAIAIAGPLTPPPGGVVSTMKTLTEVEPRIAINTDNTPGDSSNHFKITQPGSYYLTGNITCNKFAGIYITAPDVTIDLNGYRLVGTAGASEYAVLVDDESGAVRNITVKNGTVTGAFSQGGINLSADACRIERVTVRSVPDYGIGVSASSTITDCTVEKCVIGIAASSSTVTNCTVADCANIGISGVRSTIRGCSVQRNTNIGIYVQLDCVVDSCQVIDNGPGSGQGIRIAGSGTRVENNTVSGSWSGISLSDTATDNLIIRNTVRKGGGLAGIIMSGQAVNSFPNNHVAQIIVDPASPFTATNAFANIQY